MGLWVGARASIRQSRVAWGMTDWGALWDPPEAHAVVAVLRVGSDGQILSEEWEV